MMDHDAQAICGARLEKVDDRQAHRWGKTKGKIDFHDGEVEIERPRLRAFDGEEQALPRWEATTANEVRSGLTLMFKGFAKRPLARLAVGVALVGGAELTARYMGFGEPPLVILDDKIEYYLAPSRSYTRFGLAT